MKLTHCSTFAILVVFELVLSACTPKYDWREVRGPTSTFVAVFPAKSTSFTRPIHLEGQQVMMTMTAAEVDGVTFAVGTASLADAKTALNALRSMQIALVKNINGTLKSESASTNKIAQTTSIDIEAIGPPSANSGGQPTRLLARFVAKDQQIFQVVMVGPEISENQDAADTFFASFKPL